MMLINYASKKSMREHAIGQPLKYQETSMFGAEYRANGSFVAAYRPTVWAHPEGKREFFARITMVDGKIAKVE